MPLRDHFHPPLAQRKSWEGVHGGWPMKIVEELNGRLPPEFAAEPRVHLGSAFEIDVCAFESDREESWSPVVRAGDVGPAPWAPESPTLLLDSEAPTPSEYEVLVHDFTFERRLVAAIEIVSPGNKDRPENRRTFVNKCEALLRNDVCVVIVDVVTMLKTNLYRELAQQIGAADPTVRAPIYAVACRGVRQGRRWRVEAWEHELAVGQPLPTLPLWLNEHSYVPLELEATYEATCRGLRIR